MTMTASAPFSAARTYLDSLPDGIIPSDLTEIDATWVYYALLESGDAMAEAATDVLGRHELDGLAFDLRDVWHTARCERMEWDRHGRYDYD